MDVRESIQCSAKIRLKMFQAGGRCGSIRAHGFWSVGLTVIVVFYHIPPTISTPSSACPGSPPIFP